MQRKIRIDGMHCKSCELLIKDGVNDIAGCCVQNISHKTGDMLVDINDTSKINDIEKVIKAAGYELGDTTKDRGGTISKNTMNVEKIIENISRLVCAIIIVRLIGQTNVTGFIPDYTNIGFGIAILVGLIASISTCLAVTGGIIVGYTQTVSTKNIFSTQIQFHIGRLVIFIIGGLLLGFIGKQVQGILGITIILNIFVGLVLGYLGLQLLGLLPNISTLGFHLPARMSRGVFALKNPKYASIVGALTFFLPCGFTQSMQLVALQSGNPLHGALIMGGFALGTLPVLLSLGIGAKYIKEKVKYLNPLIASLLVVFGGYMIYNGYNLSTALLPLYVANNIATPYTGEVETVQVGYDGSYFVPRTITLKKGKKYIINVTPSSDGLGCKYQVVIPGVGVHTIKKGEQFQIPVDGTKEGKTKLVCASMGMPQGDIVIE